MLKAAIILGSDVQEGVLKEDVLLECIDAIELLVTDVAWILVTQLEVEPLRGIWATLFQVLVELPFG